MKKNRRYKIWCVLLIVFHVKHWLQNDSHWLAHTITSSQATTKVQVKFKETTDKIEDVSPIDFKWLLHRSDSDLDKLDRV